MAIQAYHTSTVPYAVANFADTSLAVALTDSATTMQVAAATGKEFFADQATTGTVSPMIVVLANGRTLTDLKAGEIIKITGYSGGNEDIFEISRDASSAQSWDVSDLVLANVCAENLTVFNDMFTLFAEFIAFAFGSLASGVLRTTFPTTDLEVVPTSPTSWYVEVSIGRAMVSRYPVKLSSASTVGPFVVTDLSDAAGLRERTDAIVINDLGAIETLAGTPAETDASVAPTPDADQLLLAEIKFLYSSTTITTGMIDDGRVFY